MEKGQICYFISGDNIEPVRFIERCNSQQIFIKSLNKDGEPWAAHCHYICDTKEEAYKKLLSWLEYDKQETEESIECLENELNVINENIRKLKQKYKQ